MPTCLELGATPMGFGVIKSIQGDMTEGEVCVGPTEKGLETITFFSLSDYNIYQLPISQIETIEVIDAIKKVEVEDLQFPKLLDPEQEKTEEADDANATPPQRFFVSRYGYHRKWKSRGSLVYVNRKERSKIVLKNGITDEGFMNFDLFLAKEKDLVKYGIHQEIPPRQATDNKREYKIALGNEEEKKQRIGLALNFTDASATEGIISYKVASEEINIAGKANTIEEIKELFIEALNKTHDNWAAPREDVHEEVLSTLRSVSISSGN